jgi:hypothetical protein
METVNGMKFAENGMRLTDCCGCCSSYYECDNIGCIDTLLCKNCGAHVEPGEGDGTQHRSDWE